MKHVITWHTASPLWPLALQDSSTRRFEQPALFSFVGDTFMDDFQQLLASDPQRLSEHVARRETFSTGVFDRAGWVAESQLSSQRPVKLYQPAHNRYYIVAANLVCRERGLPERAIDAGNDERASFVIRRLVSASNNFNPEQESTYDEYAWVGNRQRGAWVRQAARDSVADGEERLPSFPLPFEQEGQKRRLLAGTPPVGSREVYEGGVAPQPTAAAVGDLLSDLRMVTFRSTVIQGLEQLRDMPAGVTSAQDEDARTTLAFVMLDYSEFLSRELPRLWHAVDAQSPANLSGADLSVYNFLNSFQPIGTSTWIAILDDIAANRSQILLGALPSTLIIKQTAFNRAAIKAAAGALLQTNLLDYQLATLMKDALGDPRKAQWRDLLATNIRPLEQLPAAYTDAGAREALLAALLPLNDWLGLELRNLWNAILNASSAGLSVAEQAAFAVLESNTVRSLTWRALLADAERNRGALAAGTVTRRTSAVVSNGVTAADVRSFATAFRASALTNRINAVIDANPPPVPANASSTPAQATLYKIRFVYERPKCGPTTSPVVSKPSGAFELASFFDGEAPVRQIRIQMPLDTTIAGLRSSPKNFAIVISDELRKQMSRAQAAGLEGLMNGDVPDAPLPSLGMICSFSIPIITICALVLLLVIVTLLNIVFWWLPLFRICLPIPVKAK